MKDRIKSMMPNGITGLERVKRLSSALGRHVEELSPSPHILVLGTGKR
jgi:hypothetical protein